MAVAKPVFRRFLLVVVIVIVRIRLTFELQKIDKLKVCSIGGRMTVRNGRDDKRHDRD
jgi:hypothetical protein